MSALPRKSGHSGSSASCYDPINQSNLYDFEGTVAHEISEVLGRIFLSSKSYSAYDFFYYSSKGVHDFAANGGGYFSMEAKPTLQTSIRQMVGWCRLGHGRHQQQRRQPL